ncbi:hypothetical protein G6F65_022255 [Rhizopus arrhizus]|nr:hypothetical protein G6F65_022255 [Rhizopus arrhizus]
MTFSTPSCLLVLDQRLVEGGFALDHIDEVVHHATLAAHDEVEIAQADIEVDDSGLVAPHREARGKTGARRGFTHAAFAGSHHNNACHDDQTLMFE